MALSQARIEARDKLIARYAASEAKATKPASQVKTWNGDLWNADSRSISIVARDIMRLRGKRVVEVGKRLTGLWIHVTLDNGKQVMLTSDVLKSHAWKIAG